MFIWACAALVLWLIVLLLPWQPWRVKEQWDVSETDTSNDLSQLTVLVPARNEEQVITHNLTKLLEQGRGHRVIVIDDQSTDNTPDLLQLFGDNITVLRGSALPEGWSGKLWALEQGRHLVKTPLVMLLDADVELKTGLIRGLCQFMESNDKDLVSLMAKPPLGSIWERLLMPAFVYYFKLLYPFSLANSSSPYVAAAAGGCILMKTEALERIGGFGVISAELIDDCRLARQVKDAGYHSWLGLTRSIRSARPYGGLYEIWNMVARTAFTQLCYSPILLIVCTAVMIFAYLLPVALLGGVYPVALIGVITLMLMFITYLPVLNYYGLSWLWVFTMPAVALMYLGMTWTSAFRYWQGERMRWRGRVQ